MRASRVVFAKIAFWELKIAKTTLLALKSLFLAKTNLLALKSLFYLDFRSIGIVGSRPAKIWIK